MSQYNWAKWLKKMKKSDLIWDEDTKSFKRKEDLKTNE